MDGKLHQGQQFWLKYQMTILAEASLLSVELPVEMGYKSLSC